MKFVSKLIVIVGSFNSKNAVSHKPPVVMYESTRFAGNRSNGHRLADAIVNGIFLDDCVIVLHSLSFSMSCVV